MDLRDLSPLLLSLFFLLAGCSPTKPSNLGVTNDGTTVKGTGAVSYDTLEGGFWVIVGDDHVPVAEGTAFTLMACKLGSIARIAATAGSGRRKKARPSSR